MEFLVVAVCSSELCGHVTHCQMIVINGDFGTVAAGSDVQRVRRKVFFFFAVLFSLPQVQVGTTDFVRI